MCVCERASGRARVGGAAWAWSRPRCVSRRARRHRRRPTSAARASRGVRPAPAANRPAPRMRTAAPRTGRGSSEPCAVRQGLRAAGAEAPVAATEVRAAPVTGRSPASSTAAAPLGGTTPRPGLVSTTGSSRRRLRHSTSTFGLPVVAVRSPPRPRRVEDGSNRRAPPQRPASGVSGSLRPCGPGDEAGYQGLLRQGNDSQGPSSTSAAPDPPAADFWRPTGRGGSATGP